MKASKSIIALAIIAASSSAMALGNGGNGGQGGDATAIAGAASSASAGASAAAIQGQLQGQAQGQLQGQQLNANTGGNRLTNEGNNAAQQTSVNVEAAQTYRTAATAYAAPLAASNGTCMGSSSVGAQGTFGLSFGTTWTDASCDMRYDAESLRALGQPVAAVARLCQKAEIAQAMAAAGTPCPGTAKAAAAAPAAVPAPAVATEQYTGSDPIVMSRLGIAPLAK